MSPRLKQQQLDSRESLAKRVHILEVIALRYLADNEDKDKALDNLSKLWDRVTKLEEKEQECRRD